METNIPTFSTSFFVKNEREKQGKVPLYCRITVNAESIGFSLKRRIDQKLWTDAMDKRNQNPQVQSLRLYFDRIKSKILAYYDELVFHNSPVSPEILKNKFLGIDHDNNTICQLLSYHNENSGLKKGTLKNYYTTETYVRNFLNSKKRKDMFLSELNYQFLLELKQFIHTNPIDPKKPCNNNGVMKHMERLRKVGRLGVTLEWCDKNPFELFKLKFDKVDRNFLSDEELSRIENAHFKNTSLQLARDLFIFSCYTGPHYGDVINLKRDEVVTGFDGELWLKTSREKNTNPVLVPLLPQALELIEKYQKHPEAIARKTIFPYISNKTLNDKLKLVAEFCEINTPLSFSIARHTFSTSVTLANDVPIETLSKMLGHTKISTTQIYAKVLAKKVSRDMNKLKSVLAEKQRLKKQHSDINPEF